MAKTALLLGVGEGRPGVKLSEYTLDKTHAMLKCCCQIVAHSCTDPVYKVFVAALVSENEKYNVFIWIETQFGDIIALSLDRVLSHNG